MDYLTDAELQFRLACGLLVTHTAGNLKIDYPDIWSYGGHSVTGAEMAVVVPHELDTACAALVHSSTYLLAVEIFAAFGEQRPPDSDDELVNAYEIARLLRHAFAHQPFAPVWRIQPERCKIRLFEIDGVIRLNTTPLDGRPVRLMHFGGPLALLRLAQFVRQRTRPAA